MIELTRKMVAEAALPLLDAGKLGRQVHPKACSAYRMGRSRSPCVIGAALPDDIATLIDKAFPGIFVTDIPEFIGVSINDREWMRRAQWAHDAGKFDELRAHLLTGLED